MNEPLRVFIGYDPRQPLSFNVLANSIWRRTTKPVTITQLRLSTLPLKRRGLTEFTYSRYLVPYLSDYQGVSVFMDSDMLCLGDVNELAAFALAKPHVGVFVAKNRKKPFEWVSMMVFNNKLCTNLTPEFVEDPNNNMFNMKWAQNGVGSLPMDWNHLVGYDGPNPTPKLVHYTQGIPCWPETKDCDFAQAWRNELNNAQSTVSFENLMGQSVHVTAMRRQN